MGQHRYVVIAAVLALSVAGAPASAQRGGMMGGMTGGMPGMMGMRHDSATMQQMAVIHEMVVNHDRITRTVTNLPDGIRTVTESGDPLMAARIKEHVASMNVRIAAGDDPGLRMESPALHGLFLTGEKIRTVLDTTARGIVVVQTSTDSATVAGLQRHATEVSDLVQGGMAAMHAAMMKNGGMMPRKMPR